MQEVLLDLPGLLFFSTYTLLVLFWAEIYHQARSLSTTALRPMFVAFNGVVYAVQVSLPLLSCVKTHVQIRIVVPQKSKRTFQAIKDRLDTPHFEQLKKVQDSLRSTRHCSKCFGIASNTLPPISLAGSVNLHWDAAPQLSICHACRLPFGSSRASQGTRQTGSHAFCPAASWP